MGSAVLAARTRVVAWDVVSVIERGFLARHLATTKTSGGMVVVVRLSKEILAAIFNATITS